MAGGSRFGHRSQLPVANELLGLLNYGIRSTLHDSLEAIFEAVEPESVNVAVAATWSAWASGHGIAPLFDWPNLRQK